MTRPEIGRPDLHDTGKKHCENYCIGTFRRGSGLYTATAEYLILNNRLRGHTWGGVGWGTSGNNRVVWNDQPPAGRK